MHQGDCTVKTSTIYWICTVLQIIGLAICAWLWVLILTERAS